MAELHPDKLVGVTRAINTRPTRPARTAEQAAMAVAGRPRPITPPKEPQPAPESLLANLAYALREQHQERHLDRLARRTDAAVQGAKEQAVAEQGAKLTPAKPKVSKAEPANPTVILQIGGQAPARNG